MKSQDSKSLWTTQPEKPVHYSYLKEFRVEQCPLFLQHKCTQHRPYTCFHWHFLNQRRRRPIRKRDGSFNYSPDNYCTKFDENTGICPDGDECPFLHRTAGDTERRYHLRYYKTGMCVHDTDVRGYCVKNGAHCAFAHGVEDVRPPVYDLRELHQSMEGGLTAEGMQQLLQDTAAAAAVNGTSVVSIMTGPNGGVVPNSLDKERNMVNDDPRWQDTAFVLANYKTEQCKRPPRLCRQGYACPQYHNSRDRRRPPKKFKYRSTACPNVKHSDEWGEPSNCESGDSCQYCHTRTEQQFHPEIYKSSKCNDIQQTGYCPRGVFCAFAHVDQEMTAVRDTAVNENCGGTSLADILQSALPPDNLPPVPALPAPPPPLPIVTPAMSQHLPASSLHQTSLENAKNVAASMGVSIAESHITSNGFMSPTNNSNNMAPIGSKSRQFSGNTSSSSSCNSSSNMLPSKDHGTSSSSIFSNLMNNPPPLNTISNTSTSNYLKAPGSERENETNLKKQLAAKENSLGSLDALDKLKRKTSNHIGGSNSLFIGGNGTSSSGVLNNDVLNTSSFVSSLSAGARGSSIACTVSALAPPFYPTSNTVQSVVGNALDELNLSELSAAIDPDFSSLTSSLSTALTSTDSSQCPFPGLIGSSSAPVTIPGSNGNNGSGTGSSGSFHERSNLLSNLSTVVSSHHTGSNTAGASTAPLHNNCSPSSSAFNPHHSFLHPNNSTVGASLEQSNLAAAFLHAANGTTNASTNHLSQTSQANTSSNHLFDTSSSIINTSSNANTSSLFNNFTANTMTSLSSNLASNLSNTLNNMSPHQPSVLSQSPLLFHSAGMNSSDMWRLRDEILSNRAKLASWQEGINQARTACEAWKKEVDDAHKRIKLVEQSREELLTKLNVIQQELDECRAGKQLSPYVQVLNSHCDLDNLPRHLLQQLSTKLRTDADAVDKALNNCTLPGEWSNVPNW
uniref:RING finger protein unkempt homolog n=4 Tax=Hirondellea gigas TaxID=1518452 RepID=A0A6A7G6X3_9CRUS